MNRAERDGRTRLAPVALAALATLGALGACGDGGTVTPPGGGAASVVLVSGGDQRGIGGRAPDEPIVVRVLDADGRAAPGVTVSFQPAAGHGSTDPASPATDGNGEAATTWTLGAAAPGAQTLAVSAAGAAVTVTAEAVDLDAELAVLFAPASASELAAVRADWAGRDVSAADVAIELADEVALGESTATLRIVSHAVAGARHVGAIIVPEGAAPESLPVLVYAHGGDNGVSVDEFQLLAPALGDLADRFVYVIPSYRSEALWYEGRDWLSAGPSGHWDFDVDDVIALVNVTFESTPEARPGSFSIFGGSRGGGVSLLTGIRDPRVERVVTFFGPTDFFDAWIQVIGRKAALDGPWDLPGLIHLDSTLIRPMIRGDLPMPEARLDLVRRSSVLFAEDLPPVQLHHGTADFTVPVSQAESMILTMEALGRTPPMFEGFIYEGGGHDFFSLTGAIPRAVEFLAQTLTGEGASGR